MISPSITLDLEEVRTAIDNWMAGVNPGLEKGVRKGLLIVEAAAKPACPHKTGRLMNSLTWMIENPSPEEVIGYFGTNVYYAIYVHEGTRYMAARPFMSDAIAANRDLIHRVIIEEVAKELTT